MANPPHSYEWAWPAGRRFMMWPWFWIPAGVAQFVLAAIVGSTNLWAAVPIFLLSAVATVWGVFMGCFALAPYMQRNAAWREAQAKTLELEMMRTASAPLVNRASLLRALGHWEQVSYQLASDLDEWNHELDHLKREIQGTKVVLRRYAREAAAAALETELRIAGEALDISDIPVPFISGFVDPDDTSFSQGHAIREIRAYAAAVVARVNKS